MRLPVFFAQPCFLLQDCDFCGDEYAPRAFLIVARQEHPRWNLCAVRSMTAYMPGQSIFQQLGRSDPWMVGFQGMTL